MSPDEIQFVVFGISGGLSAAFWATASVFNTRERERTRREEERTRRDAMAHVVKMNETNPRGAAQIGIAIAARAVPPGAHGADRSLPIARDDPYPDDPHDQQQLTEGLRRLPSATERE